MYISIHTTFLGCGRTLNPVRTSSIHILKDFPTHPSSLAYCYLLYFSLVAYCVHVCEGCVRCVRSLSTHSLFLWICLHLRHINVHTSSISWSVYVPMMFIEYIHVHTCSVQLICSSLLQGSPHARFVANLCGYVHACGSNRVSKTPLPRPYYDCLYAVPYCPSCSAMPVP